MNCCIINILIFISFSNLTLLSGSKINDVRNYLGTRTPYRFRYNKDDSKIKYPHCKDSKIWMIIRHGTRLPSAKDIKGMNTILKDIKYQILLQHKLGKGELTKEQLDVLEEWSSQLDEENEKILTLEGQDEMILLAERMQKRFPNAIKDKYSNKTYLFRYTATQRAQQSARFFTHGLFDKKDAQDVIFLPANKVDPVLRFYKHCDRWQRQVKKNPDTYKEQKAFGISSKMNQTLESVSARLGLNRVLSLAEVNLMYKACGYETSWNKHHTSPWCYAFDDKNAMNLEYYHDIKHYWMDGYGHNLTYRQACLAVQTMFKIFREKPDPFAIFMFAHSGTLLKIITHMQLFKPESPLTGDAIDSSRPWKASEIDCFASNLAFVLFKCKDGDHILTLHQEKVIRLPMCEKDLCPMERLMEYFHESIHNCDYSDMCSLDKDSK